MNQLLLVGAVLATAILGSTAFGGAPIGPPMALMGEGQWGIGIEFGMEEMDLSAAGTLTETSGLFSDASDELFDVEDLESNMIFGNLAYGVCDNWDVYLRLGAANAEDDVRTGPGETPLTFDGSYGFAWGVGSRATFCRSGAWSFGGVLQVTWVDPGDDSYSGSGDRDGLPSTWAGDIDMDYWQTQVGLAAIYQVDLWSVWVGPFLQFVDGDLDVSENWEEVGGINSGTIDASMDLKQESEFGVLFGASYDISTEWNLWVEGQWSDDSWLFGIGALLKPEDLFSGM
ncbi:MAG: hypothetical protein JW741_10930 [Sedimentisphaerales bacterium]|nr:hypothetical protein [Sedimentisphaerales bacterium]